MNMKSPFIAIVSVWLGSVVFGPGAALAAEKYPVKPILCIVGVEAGADGDVLVRPIMQRVSQMLGQPIVIVNKPGGGSSIAYREIHSKARWIHHRLGIGDDHYQQAAGRLAARLS